MFNFPNNHSYLEASPYPHIVIDNFVQCEKLINDAVEAFPGTEDIPWQRFRTEKERKLAYADVWDLPEKHDAVCDLATEMLSPEFVKELEVLTGQKKLYADHSFMGGGLHRIERDGLLGIHTDFNFHPHMKKTRKINLLLFLNKDWDERYGGHVELWDKDMEHCLYKITPKFNRAVIFTIDDTSWHGHPHPLMCPPDIARKSIALYYYTEGTPAKIHSTIFQPVNPKGYHNTITIS